jgi:hypothetical protein
MRAAAWLVTVAAVLVTAVSALAAVAGNETAPATSSAIKQQTECPVMGGAINRKIFVDHEGKRVYVCCKGCIKTVQADPAKYIKKLEAEGVTLDKTPPAGVTAAPEASAHQEQKGQ